MVLLVAVARRATENESPTIAGRATTTYLAASPKSESLPRARVIRRRGVFDASRTKGRRISNRFMTRNCLSRDAVKSGETGTVAFLTPKRLGSAPKRNQLRRRMWEIYRRCLADMSEKNYLIWIARPPALELPFEELKNCMEELMRRGIRASIK